LRLPGVKPLSEALRMEIVKISVSEFAEFKRRRQRFAALTAYDFPTTRRLDRLKIPLILVGDSLGMVALGYEDTTFVTMADIEHHLRACARAKPNALLAADLPFGSYGTETAAAENAQRLVAAGAEAVKAEGGLAILPQIRAIVAAGVPFIGHLGMLPQSVREEGGYRVKGKSDDERQALLDDAARLVNAGAFAVVLELIKPPVAREITEAIAIPTIGIGSGPDCDAQILVTNDLLRTSPDYIPRHVPETSIDVGTAADTVIAEWKRSIENA
jgi:3-methyl-2-oxobutanoate hydroxymethyltransferase